MRGNKHIKKRCFAIAVLTVFASVRINSVVRAESCPDLRIVFARGSGGELNNDPNYLEFKSTIEQKLVDNVLDYEFVDLDYPAVGVGIDHLGVTVGAYFGAGEAYEFGDSVKSGVKKIDNLVDGSCSNTKYVLGGYSQGAIVISKSLSNLIPERVIFAATFGDPKIYLPEGKGLNPPACSNNGLSDYRFYVPDCHAYKGLLGPNIPYQPDGFIGKLGTWCNKNDIFCSSHFNINDHVSYISDNLYEDASRVIMDKISRHFGLENHYASPHDTAIVIDSSGSMENLIIKYKEEAFRLAKETIESGGRVALFDYRDLDDPYSPVEHCNFETCTLDVISRELDTIETDGGGDEEESLLSASFHVMETLKWQRGATKSLVVLTDAGFLSPDRDGITYADAVNLSKKIDPVNFYIITEPENAEAYQELALATDGKVVTEAEDFSLLTDYIMDRYDSLPRVEEDPTSYLEPTLEIIEQNIQNNQATIKYVTTGTQTIVILNDKIIGFTDQAEIVIGGINWGNDNEIILVPISENVRGDGVKLQLNAAIKVPNTGRL